jgi:3-oxoacyl-[acyl-carrier-protein] synthase-3
MSYLRGFGACLPQRIVDNAEIAALTGVTRIGFWQASGIESAGFAGQGDTVASLGAGAARDCLTACGAEAGDVGCCWGERSAERCFPCPAGTVGVALGIAECRRSICRWPARVPLFGLALAGSVGAHVWERAGDRERDHVARGRACSEGRDTAILFGDGAGACLVSAEGGLARIEDSVLHSDRRCSRGSCGWNMTGPLTWMASR